MFFFSHINSNAPHSVPVDGGICTKSGFANQASKKKRRRRLTASCTGCSYHIHSEFFLLQAVIMSEDRAERSDGRIVKMEVDYSATVDQRLPECEKMAKVSVNERLSHAAC